MRRQSSEFLLVSRLLEYRQNVHPYLPHTDRIRPIMRPSYVRHSSGRFWRHCIFRQAMTLSDKAICVWRSCCNCANSSRLGILEFHNKRWFPQTMHLFPLIRRYYILNRIIVPNNCALGGLDTTTSANPLCTSMIFSPLKNLSSANGWFKAVTSKPHFFTDYHRQDALRYGSKSYPLQNQTGNSREF